MHYRTCIIGQDSPKTYLAPFYKPTHSQRLSNYHKGVPSFINRDAAIQAHLTHACQTS